MPHLRYARGCGNHNITKALLRSHPERIWMNVQAILQPKWHVALMLQALQVLYFSLRGYARSSEQCKAIMSRPQLLGLCTGQALQ